MSTTLGVAILEYLPWAILNYMGIVFAIILAFTGIGIAELTPNIVITMVLYNRLKLKVNLGLLD